MLWQIIRREYFIMLSFAPTSQKSNMLIRVEHETVLDYSEPVCETVIEVRMSPPSTEDQTVSGYRLKVVPHVPTANYRDGFGNRVDLFNISAGHNRIQISSTCYVRTHRRANASRLAELPWPVAGSEPGHDVDVLEFLRFSPFVDDCPELTGFVERLPRNHKSFAAGLDALMLAVNERLKYEKQVTTAQTRLSEALQLGRGVCQDYAHLFLGACRGLGIPARYVSGYVNQPGELATHAWCQVWAGTDLGWIDIDPTRGQFVDGHHVVIATGRDFSDVAPNKGCSKGLGVETISVAVKVETVDRMPTNWSDHVAVNRPQPPRSIATSWYANEGGLRQQAPSRTGPLRHQQSQQQQASC